MRFYPALKDLPSEKLGDWEIPAIPRARYFETNFQSVRLQPPGNESLADFLARRWAAPITITRRIAEGAKGNVRAALADFEMWMGSASTEADIMPASASQP